MRRNAPEIQLNRLKSPHGKQKARGSLRETSGFLPSDAGSTGTTMQGHTAFGVHFALAIKAEGSLWLAGEFSALLLLFLK